MFSAKIFNLTFLSLTIAIAEVPISIPISFSSPILCFLGGVPSKYYWNF